MSQNFSDGKQKKVFERYIGVTLDYEQYVYASHRLKDDPHITIFQADAAKKVTWDGMLGSAVKPLMLMEDGDDLSKDKDEKVESWVLALDTLYHFSPSREPLLTFARKKLYASFLAFDLLVGDDVPLWSRTLLRILAVLMGCPYNTFKTEKEYRTLLTECGYAGSKIEMRDISEHVFEPLSRFLEDRDKALQRFGWSLGKLRAAKWLFDWWGRSGIVRGMVIVARK
jgi:hypothetical protein